MLSVDPHFIHFTSKAVLFDYVGIRNVLFILRAAEEDPLTFSCGRIHLRLFLPAPAAPRWSLQIVS